MFRNRLVFAVAILLVGALAAYRVTAQDHPGGDHPKDHPKGDHPKDHPKGDHPKAPPKDEAKKDHPEHPGADSPEMQAWMKYSMPGEHHKRLAAQAGTWDAVGKFWMKPDAPPSESKGSEVITSMFGDRFQKVEFKGDGMAPGESFEGFGLGGYDNITQKHFMIWTDSMSTLVVRSEGTCTDGCKVLTLNGEYPDPMTGGKSTRKFRWVMTAVSDAEMKLDGYETGADGKEWKNMEIVYKKK